MREKVEKMNECDSRESECDWVRESNSERGNKRERERVLEGLGIWVKGRLGLKRESTC